MISISHRSFQNTKQNTIQYNILGKKKEEKKIKIIIRIKKLQKNT